MHRRALFLTNELFSRTGGAIRVWHLFIITFGLAAGFVAISGITGSYTVMGLFIAFFVVFVAFLFSIYFSRLSLISWALRRELTWFRNNDPTVLIGVGPGGAILAGLVAKHMAREFDLEPHVLVANRIFRKSGPRTELETAVPEIFLESLSGKNLEELSERHRKIIVITPEIHSGATIV